MLDSLPSASQQPVSILASLQIFKIFALLNKTFLICLYGVKFLVVIRKATTLFYNSKQPSLTSSQCFYFLVAYQESFLTWHSNNQNARILTHINIESNFIFLKKKYLSRFSSYELWPIWQLCKWTRRHRHCWEDFGYYSVIGMEIYFISLHIKYFYLLTQWLMWS